MMKKSKFKKAAALLIALISLLLCGCGTNQTANDSSDALEYWVMLNANASQIASSYGETAIGKKLMENTGVQIEYVHPPQGQHAEKFNLPDCRKRPARYY